MKQSFTFDGEVVTFEPGDSVAAALIRSGQNSLRRTRFAGRERSIFCGIGQCFDCILVIDGRSNQRACLIPAQEGMKVESQDGVGRMP